LSWRAATSLEKEKKEEREKEKEAGDVDVGRRGPLERGNEAESEVCEQGGEMERKQM